MHKKQDGFTLTEVLIAVMILSLAVAAFGSVFGSSIQAIWGAGNHHIALTEAQSLLERAIADLSLGETEGVFRDPLTLNEQEGTLLTVKIPWQTGLGSERVLELSTFRASP
jgi:prepilin-type N-terminal cleavage/methylation domain-containing protein